MSAFSGATLMITGGTGSFAFCGAQRPLMRLASATMRNITAA